MIWKEVGNRIKKIRRDNNMTQAQFGRIFGITRQFVGKIESGQKLSVELIVDISQKTGVTIDYIVLGTTDPASDMAMISDLSTEQINISLDILKKIAELINTNGADNTTSGNELLIKEIMQRQRLTV